MQQIVALSFVNASTPWSPMKVTRRVARPPSTASMPRTGAVRPGGRSARVVEDVLRATLAEINRVGYAALRIEEVAARSGVNKTTIYRRWPTKADLVLGAVSSIKAPVSIGDTGDLVRDFTDGFVEHLSHATGPELRGLLRMMQFEREHPEVNAMLRELRERSAEGRRQRLRAAVARGELPPRTDIELVQFVLSAAVFGPLVRMGEVIPAERVERIVALVIAGARAVGGSARARP